MRISQLIIGLGVMLFIALSGLMYSTASAQITPPTPLPIPTEMELVVVAGGRGAELYRADGTLIRRIAAGERLIASKRSGDNEWLLVTTPDGTEGWAARGSLIIFERIALPTEDIVIEPIPVLAESAPTEPVDEQSNDGVNPAIVTTNVAISDTMTNDTATNLSSTMATVSTGSARLNIRSGPGTGYPVIAKAVAGETVMVAARNNNQRWLQISSTDIVGGFGWVAAEYVTLDGSIGDLAIARGVNAAADMFINTPQPTSLSATSTPVQSAMPAVGFHGKLVFMDRNGGTIYLYELTTGALRPLTNGFDPAFSPDGTQVAFTRGGGENGVYVINVDGSNERQIFGERELLRSPKWSPDSKYIVFVRGDEFNRCFLDEDTGECLRRNPFNTEGFESGKDPTFKLARIDTNGDSYRDLAVVPEAFAPDWSSAGVVYQSAAGLQITQDTPEDNNRLLYFDIQRQYHQDPDWQQGPEGTPGRILFHQRGGGHYQIWGINPDGSGLAALTRPVTTLVDQLPSNVAPAWSPDGRHIVFLSNRTEANNAGPWRLWVMNADGSNQRSLPINVPIHYDYVLEQMVDWGP